MTSRIKLTNRFQDKEYRSTYVNGFLDSYIAAQIRALRDARGLSQAELAELIRTRQSAVSKLENVNYSGWSIRTLRNLAKAFDVALVVKFVAFGEALSDIEGFNITALVKPAFPEDPVFRNAEIQSDSATTAVMAPVEMAHVPVRQHRHLRREHTPQFPRFFEQTYSGSLSSTQV